MSCIVASVDQCFHHYDDFIVPKSSWLMRKWKTFTGEKDDLKAMSMMQHLQCYSDAFDHPTALRRMLCEDVAATIQDISCKFTHLKDGFSCPTHSYGYSRPEPLSASKSSKLKTVRANFVLCYILFCAPIHMTVG